MSGTERPVALVTGGRHGIGKGIAMELARAGFDLAITVRKTDGEAEATVGALAEMGGRARLFESDLGDLESHQPLIQAVAAWAGGLDCLVNNAGISSHVRGDLLELQAASFDDVLGVNLRGSFFLTQAAARWMLASPSDHYRSILFVSSVNAVMAATERGDYCLSKAGLSMATRLFALRLAEAQIGVFELRPGIIRTAMTEVAAERHERRITEGLVPAGRWGTPEDIGAAAVPFATGAMAFATGSVIELDGGLSIRRM
jgi:NAD(P)-dependent dehydrogenase (short-subunit alcohol dehydrogenase family)